MKKTKKPFEWNKVTPLSKSLAMGLFVALPFIGFVLGMKYQKIIIVNNLPISSNSIGTQSDTVISSPSPNPEKIETYIDNNYGFSLVHSSGIKIIPKHSSINKPLTEINFTIDDGKMSANYVIGVTKSVVDDFTTSLLCNEFCHFDKQQTVPITISGIVGKSYSKVNKWTLETTQVIVIKRNNLDYYFIITSLNEAYALNNLLSKFKFI